ncbi:filamin-B-like isoform X2 [Salvelinus alpinus]
MKLILGLVWILHYSISSHLLEDEGQDKTKKQTPELRLLGGSWTRCLNCLSPTSARTGRMAWLLGHWWTDWPQVNYNWIHEDNIQRCCYWGIAPEEIIDPRVDEQSIMTYHSMFPKAQLKPGAPLNPQSGSMDKSRAERCACDL